MADPSTNNGTGIEDIMSSAAGLTAQMVPERQGGSLLSFGPQAPSIPPLPTYKAPPIQPAKAGNEFSTESARRSAEMNGIINNVASAIGAGANFIQQKKMRALSMDIERLMSAMSGLQEAKDSGNQEGVEKNTAIINDITSDPKKVKQLQKAFNIDLLGGGKNKAENQALFLAHKNYTQSKGTDKSALNPIAQRLMASQPWRQQLSPEAQAQAAAIKAGLLPKAGEILKATQENFKSILTAKTSEERDAALEKAAKLRADAEINHGERIVDAANIRSLGQQATAEINARARRYIADSVSKTWDKRLAEMESITKLKTGDSPIFKNLTSEARTYNDRLKSLVAENTKYAAQLKQGSGFTGMLFGSSALKGADATVVRNKMMLNNLEMQKIQQDLDSVTNKMKLMDQMGIINIKELSQSNSGGTGGNSGGNDQEPTDEDTDTGE